MLLVLGDEEDNIVGPSDADHAGNKATRKSTGRFVFTPARGALSWNSKIQSVVPHSTVESEYIAQSRFLRKAL